MRSHPSKRGGKGTKTIRTPGPGKHYGKKSKGKKKKAPPKKPPTLMETRAMNIERNRKMMKSLGFDEASDAWEGLGKMNSAGIGLSKAKVKKVVKKQKKKVGPANRASKRIALKNPRVSKRKGKGKKP